MVQLSHHGGVMQSIPSPKVPFFGNVKFHHYYICTSSNTCTISKDGQHLEEVQAHDKDLGYTLRYFKEKNRAGTGKSESMKDDLIWRKLFLK